MIIIIGRLCLAILSVTKLASVKEVDIKIDDENTTKMVECNNLTLINFILRSKYFSPTNYFQLDPQADRSHARADPDGHPADGSGHLQPHCLHHQIPSRLPAVWRDHCLVIIVRPCL